MRATQGHTPRERDCRLQARGKGTKLWKSTTLRYYYIKHILY